MLLFAVVLALGFGSTLLLSAEGSERPSDALAYVLVIAAALPILQRRTHALLALGVSVPPVMAYWILDYPGGSEAALYVLFFSATRHGGPDRRSVWKVVGVCLAIVETVAIVGVLSPVEDLPPIAVLGIFIAYATSASVGEALYQRSKYVEELEQRTAALEADLETKAVLAATEERTRIAREMHDIIAHGMSTIVVQSQAAQGVVQEDPAKARELLETIENIGRDSVTEMRRMLGVLREHDPKLELEPQPTLSNLSSLGSQLEVDGVDLELHVVGEERALSPGIELTAYRVVQEALTNVLRHAGRPVAINARIEYGPSDLAITVSDDGRGASSSATSPTGGHGLVGMRERVELYDGEWEAGPRSGGGYSVAVRLPLTTS